ncbi:MAG TPA: CAP domain-containing protein [Kofleriaceae bacterium]|nr:CAP domain-containing protein [Kofleriaceae bacterium]
MRVLGATLLCALIATGCTGEIDTGAGDDGDARSGTDAPPGSGADAAPGSPDASNDEPGALMGVTAAHNDVRAALGIPDLVWDPALAAVAQAWVEQCVDNESPIGLIDHNAGRSDDYPGYVGENIYGSGGNATGPAAVALWVSEESDYDYATNTCAPGKICGHYTQVVWRDTERLGCGLHDCAGLTYGSSVVCNYSPGGNTGGRPY